VRQGEIRVIQVSSSVTVSSSDGAADRPGSTACENVSGGVETSSSARAGDMRACKTGDDAPAISKWRTNQKEFTQYRNSYWAMPNSLVETGALARLWKAGGVVGRKRCGSALAILPIIGIHMNSLGKRGYYADFNKLARLSGISPRSVADVGPILAAMKLGAQVVRRTPNYLPVSTWTLSTLAYVRAPKGGHVKSNYNRDSGTDGFFRFPASAVFGGSWQRLTRTQQCIYLGVGANARAAKDEKRFRGLLEHCIEQAFIDQLCARTNRFVYCFASYSDIMRWTGIKSTTAISNALHSLPPLALSGGSLRVDMSTLLATATSAGGGKRLFVFFNDVESIDGIVASEKANTRSTTSPLILAPNHAESSRTSHSGDP
jgi:hypothetical protein